MNSQKLEETWQEVCDQVKSYNNIDPSQISAFFSRLHPQAMSEGFLMLTADNDFIKTWIERHYVGFIKQALEDLFHVSFTVIIEESGSEDGENAETGQDGPTSTLTFENFVIGDSNRMAYSMAVAVAEMPGKAHLNPLFIY